MINPDGFITIHEGAVGFFANNLSTLLTQHDPDTLPAIKPGRIARIPGPENFVLRYRPTGDFIPNPGDPSIICDRDKLEAYLGTYARPLCTYYSQPEGADITSNPWEVAFDLARLRQYALDTTLYDYDPHTSSGTGERALREQATLLTELRDQEATWRRKQHNAQAGDLYGRIAY